MGWSGGTFTRSNGTFSGATVWAQDRDAGTLITASNHDTHDEDLADGINACLTKDGTNSPSAHLQWIKSNYWGGTSGGSANAQTVTLSPAPTTYYAGMEIKFIPGNANTGAATLNVNSLGAKSIKLPEGRDVSRNELNTQAVVHVVYDGTDFVLVSMPSFRINSDDWIPTYSANGSMTYSSVTTTAAWYTQIGRLCFFQISASGTTGGSADSWIGASLPLDTVSSYNSSTLQGAAAGSLAESGTPANTAHVWISDSDNGSGVNGLVKVYKSDRTNLGLSSGTAMQVTGFYYTAS